ncbi:MAG: protein kinase [Verrucomicrobia bacterium]|nr:protein kinase [Verrucomicrobiota bacterium]
MELPQPISSEPPFPIPQQIGKYKIEGLLTKGGMSLLYLGTDPLTQEPVIVKVLLPKYLSQPDMVNRFLNEAQVIALANHPNIVKLYDYGRWENGLYIAMEFVKGISLRKILAHQPFSLKRSLEVLLQIAYAICHLHAHGIIHGDLKPENILINDQGQVKVIDFGIALLLTQKKPVDNGQPQMLIGTPIYMSPEQHVSYLNISFQSDIYSLGIIAYELTLGRISHGRIVLSLAPQGLQKILHKALQPQPEDRYSDMVDFIADLLQYVKSGAFQKDKHGSDYFLELFEKLEGFQTAILPSAPPEWQGIEIGHLQRQDIGLSGLYYDFLDLSSTKKAIFISESVQKGAEGVILSSMLSTCVRTLLTANYALSPLEFLKKLFERIDKDLFAAAFSLCYVVIDTSTHSLEFFQKGYGTLLHADAHSTSITPIVTEAISELQSCRYGHIQYKPNDRFLLLGHTEVLASEIVLDLLKESFKEVLNLPPQTQVELILRKFRLKSEIVSEEHALSLFSLVLQ